MLAKNIKQSIRESLNHSQQKDNDQQPTKPIEMDHPKPEPSTKVDQPISQTQPTARPDLQIQIEHLTGLLQNLVRTQTLNQHRYPQVMYPTNVVPFLKPRYVNQAIRP